MILVYHKVAPRCLSRYWVSVAAFRRQMAALRNRRVVWLDDYDPADPEHCVITFDDAYLNVLTYAAPVLMEHGYPFEVFANGGLLGRWNTFDQPEEPAARICTRQHLRALVQAGARIQWHTLTHKNLAETSLADTLPELRVRKRLTEAFPPPHFRWFSYPYGGIGEPALRAVRVLFDGAVGVQYLADPTDRHRLPRIEMVEDSDPASLRHDPAPLATGAGREDRAAAGFALLAMIEQSLPAETGPYPGHREWLRE